MYFDFFHMCKCIKGRLQETILQTQAIEKYVVILNLTK